jgi:hypothetical protein
MVVPRLDLYPLPVQFVARRYNDCADSSLTHNQQANVFQERISTFCDMKALRHVSDNPLLLFSSSQGHKTATRTIGHVVCCFSR